MCNRDTLNADDEVSGALQRAWKHLGASDLVVADRDPSEALVAFSAGVAMFTRNLVAGHRTLQDKCLYVQAHLIMGDRTQFERSEVQSDIRKVLFASSSFSRMADPQCRTLPLTLTLPRLTPFANGSRLAQYSRDSGASELGHRQRRASRSLLAGPATTGRRETSHLVRLVSRIEVDDGRG